MSPKMKTLLSSGPDDFVIPTTGEFRSCGAATEKNSPGGGIAMGIALAT